MSVPDYQSFMYPLLKYAEDGAVHKTSQAYEDLALDMELSEEDKSELLPSGAQNVYKNRIGWASTYLKKAGLIMSEKRGFFQITDIGKKVLSSSIDKIDNSYLKQFDSFNDFQNREASSDVQSAVSASEQTPDEAIEAAVTEMNNSLASDLLEKLKDNSPAFFEKAVVELILGMGYGGSRKEAGKIVGKSSDGGIDGIIKEDKLGLDVIYIQAKRWEGVVSRPEIQKFVGALQGQRARKGIFITTSRFSKEAEDYAVNIDTKVILIDGSRLADLMIEHNLGVTPVQTYTIKKLDTDYFIEE
ncbi:MAG: restriction endonuclease [Spirochaetales bacterium]|nr:restriction endonuclease [Spirochaetales bacterium]